MTECFNKKNNEAKVDHSKYELKYVFLI